MWILRYGDVINIGRTLLLFGSPEEIARRLASLRGVDLSAGVQLDHDDLDRLSPSISLESELCWGEQPDARAVLHTLLPPELPTGLNPGQAAQLSEVLLYLHLRLRGLVNSVAISPKSDRVVLEQRQWQNVLDLHARIAAYLRAIGEPET